MFCETDKAPNTKHKEEGTVRKELDKQDRLKIRKELARYSHQLQSDGDILYSVATGQNAPEKITVHDALSIGQCMAAALRESLSKGV